MQIKRKTAIGIAYFVAIITTIALAFLITLNY